VLPTSAELVAWSRLGSSFAPAELEDARAGGALVELRGMIRPIDHVALYRADMARWDTAGRTIGERLWDLAERIYPDDPIVPAAEGACAVVVLEGQYAGGLAVEARGVSEEIRRTRHVLPDGFLVAEPLR
jgi:hypothetical protein